MTTKSTRDWLDLYDMMLDRAVEVAKDPYAASLKRGVSKEELDKQQAIAPLPGGMDMKRYHELMSSWRRVRSLIQVFGLELGDDLEIAPPSCLNVGTKPFNVWFKRPWLEVSRGLGNPLRFEGRDAITAHGFFAIYINQMETLDPSKKIKESLAAQGITKENFHERLAGTAITNPWAEDDLTQPAKG